MTTARLHGGVKDEQRPSRPRRSEQVAGQAQQAEQRRVKRADVRMWRKCDRARAQDKALR